MDMPWRSFASSAVAMVFPWILDIQLLTTQSYDTHTFMYEALEIVGYMYIVRWTFDVKPLPQLLYHHVKFM